MKFKNYKKVNDDFWEKAEMRELSASQLALCFCFLKYLKYDSNIAICSLRELENTSKTSKKTLLKNLTYLEEQGFIERLQDSGYKNSYILSYAYVGLTEKQNSVSEVHEEENYNKQVPGSRLLQEVGENNTMSYICKNKKTNKKKTSSTKSAPGAPSKKDDVFFDNHKFNPEKLELCKQYLNHLKAIKAVTVKQSEAQYLVSIYKNNEAADTWANLKEKVSELEIQITEKNNVKKTVQETVKKEAENVHEDNVKSNAMLDTLYKNKELFLELKKQAIIGLKLRLPAFNEHNPMSKQLLETQIIELFNQKSKQEVL